MLYDISCQGLPQRRLPYGITPSIRMVSGRVADNETRHTSSLPLGLGRAIMGTDGSGTMTLPVKTTTEDVRQIVMYFKSKPTGATVTEAKSALGDKPLDARKLTTYRFWGFLDKEGDRFKLSPRGWELARKPEAEQDVFRQVIDSIAAYRSATEWIHFQELDSPTVIDVGSHWHEHHQDAVGSDVKDATLRENAVAYFHLAEAAGLGKMVIGRGGNPTRLSVDRNALKAYIEAGPSTPPWTDSGGGTEAVEESGEAAAQKAGSLEDDDLEAPEGAKLVAPSAPTVEQLRVFIAHGKNLDVVEQVQTLLELADIESEVAEAEETTAIPVPDKVLDAMRRCRAGIISVTVEENRKDASGAYALNENVLIEIGAAFVLYERRVVLLWDKRLPVPSNLQGLYRCEFEGDELTWSAGMKLMKAIQGFKK